VSWFELVIPLVTFIVGLVVGMFIVWFNYHSLRALVSVMLIPLGRVSKEQREEFDKETVGDVFDLREDDVKELEERHAG